MLVGFALPEATRHALAMVVSELVSNSIRHAGLAADDVIDLHVTVDDRVVRVAVHDRGSGFTPPAPAGNPLVVGGQGIVIVAALSDEWGVDCDQDGCTVWCEIPLEEAPVEPVRRRLGARRRSASHPFRAMPA
jgi:anti-sigma regulatory factor (Ser/Thr protein kinase)